MLGLPIWNSPHPQGFPSSSWAGLGRGARRQESPGSQKEGARSGVWGGEVGASPFTPIGASGRAERLGRVTETLLPFQGPQRGPSHLWLNAGSGGP